MERRTLLAVLAGGGVGAALLSSEWIGGEPRGTESTTAGRDSPLVQWGAEFDRRLGNLPDTYGAVSFDYGERSVTLDGETALSEIRLRTAADGRGDRVRVATAGSDYLTPADVGELFVGLWGLDLDASETVRIDGQPVEFTGGGASIGDFAALVGTAGDAALAARGEDEETAVSIVESWTRP